MPAWAGKWKGGRYYLDENKRKVFFIERRKRSVRLKTHDPALALGELARFLEDPHVYTAAPEPKADRSPFFITPERITLYIESIRDTVEDHRRARASYLEAWQAKALDLKRVDRDTLRKTLGSFGGGHAGRTEALNAFARFMVREGELATWNPLVNTKAPKATRAEREAYSLEQLAEAYALLTDGPVKDLFLLRATTGMHHTEIEQLEGAKLITGPLPDSGVAIRTLDGKHEIKAVLQVMHKSRHRHRQPVDAKGLAAALRLRDGVPGRIVVWEAIKPLVPSNLRHTFVTLAGEVGSVVTYVSAGVDRARIAQAVGHRAGSTMTADRYDKLQVPPMIKLPLNL